MPLHVYQNGKKCIGLALGGAAFPSFTFFGSVAKTPISVSGPNIIGVDGQPLAMKGVNWFGFDVRILHSISLNRSLSVTCNCMLLESQPTAFDALCLNAYRTA